jgi:hypothetical protein
MDWVVIVSLVGVAFLSGITVGEVLERRHQRNIHR